MIAGELREAIDSADQSEPNATSAAVPAALKREAAKRAVGLADQLGRGRIPHNELLVHLLTAFTDQTDTRGLRRGRRPHEARDRRTRPVRLARPCKAYRPFPQVDASICKGCKAVRWPDGGCPLTGDLDRLPGEFHRLFGHGFGLFPANRRREPCARDGPGRNGRSRSNGKRSRSPV